MADHDSDIPQDDQGAVPNPHRGEPLPVADEHTQSAPDADVVRPDQEEELGPIEGLMHASATEAKTEVADDPSAEAEAQRLGIEDEGVEASQIFSLLVATVVTLALAVFGVFWLVAKYADDEQVERDGEAFYSEIMDVRARDTDLLENYGRTDDVYRIKIDDAMSLVAADYAGQQSDGQMKAPVNFRTVYLGNYFGESDSTSTLSMPEALDEAGQPLLGEPVEGTEPAPAEETPAGETPTETDEE